MLSELTGLSSGLRAVLIAAAALLALALAAALWGLKSQAERIGGLETETATLTAGLQGATDAYAALQAWAADTAAAAARAATAKQAAAAKTARVNERIDHAPAVACPVLDAAFDQLRAEYPDDPGAAAATAGAGRRPDAGNPGPADPRP